MTFYSLGSLITKVQNRSDLKKTLSSVQVIEVTNLFLQQILPASKQQMARALVYNHQTLVIGCLNSAVAQYVIDHESMIQENIKQRFPKISLKRLVTKIKSLQTYEI